MYTSLSSRAGCKNHATDETPRLRSYPGAQGKLYACGGSVRRDWVRAHLAASNEAGKPTREGGKPLALAIGRCHVGEEYIRESSKALHLLSSLFLLITVVLIFTDVLCLRPYIFSFLTHAGRSLLDLQTGEGREDTKTLCHVPY